MNLRILTFNWHEGYIHLLAKTGYQFDVVQRLKGGRFGWIHEFRPVPPNCRLITEDEAKTGLASGCYDRAICHNLQDFTLVAETPIPKVLLHHNKPIVETGISDRTEMEEFLRRLHSIYSQIKDLTLVFISETKKDSWGLEGEVILPGIDHSDYQGWEGREEKVLRVGNLLMERAMLGYSVQERILNGLSSTILGLNPRLPHSIMPKDWSEFKEFLRNHRVYMNTTIPQYEDGYNLAMLEAMATGMPVVSIANPTSPIEDAVNGFISEDENYLHRRIEELLKDHSLARSLGQKARQTVTDKFPISKFINEWRRILGDSLYSAKPAITGRETERLRILMSYTSNPQTTAAYIEKALRKNHDVMTYGPTISEDILKIWDLEKIKDRIKDHDIPYVTSDLKEVLKKLPSGWNPDIFLWVETGIEYLLEGIESLPCLSACYLIDNHLNLEKHIDIAKRFDIVFIAQKEYLVHFKNNGMKNIFWLPLACDAEIHGKKGNEKLYDIGFVGSLNNPKRIEILNKLGEKFNVYYERCFLEKMAEVFSQSRIVFNSSARNDLNMRVFEALCSGSLLLTDEAKGSGLTELFQDRKHLVIYRDEKELFKLADYYLKHDEERVRIAEAGMREVLSKHTYGHRVEEMLEIIKGLKIKKKEVKLHIGCGSDYKEDYINIDGFDRSVADLIALSHKLPFTNNSVDLIESHHLLEHLSYSEFRDTIREWHRALKYGGKITAECPDLIENMKIFLSSDYTKRWLWYRGEHPYGRLRAIYGVDWGPGQLHKSGFDKERITGLLDESGLKGIKCSSASGTPEEGENFIVEAYKPTVEDEGFSLILPTFSAVKELDLCLLSLKKNSRLRHELIILVDTGKDRGTINFDIIRTLNKHRLSFHVSYFVNSQNLGPYGSWNRGAHLASRDILAFITDDQYFAPDWDINIKKYITPDRMLTSKLVEPGLIGVWKYNLEYNCGESAEDFDEEKFIQFVRGKSLDGISEGGFYIPLVIHRGTFFKIGGFPTSGQFGVVDEKGDHLAYPNDVAFHRAAEKRGVKLYQVMNSFSYHFQGSSWMKKACRLAKDDGRPYEYYKRALKLNPENLDALLGLIEIGKETDVLKEVVPFIEDYLMYHPANIDVLFKHAEVCHSLGALDKALVSLEKILIFEPEWKDVLNLKERITGAECLEKI